MKFDWMSYEAIIDKSDIMAFYVVALMHDFISYIITRSLIRGIADPRLTERKSKSRLGFDFGPRARVGIRIAVDSALALFLFASSQRINATLFSGDLAMTTVFWDLFGGGLFLEPQPFAELFSISFWVNHFFITFLNAIIINYNFIFVWDSNFENTASALSSILTLLPTLVFIIIFAPIARLLSVQSIGNITARIVRFVFEDRRAPLFVAAAALISVVAIYFGY